MDVAVVGAGVAGLVAAHLLRTAGHAVTVIERDTDASDTAGYRLHLDSKAVGVLQTALPENTFGSLIASGAHGEAFAHLVILDERGTTLLRVPRGDGSLMIGRRPLRRILLRGWAADVKWGVVAAEVRPSGPMRTAIIDTDGDEVLDADLVVIADGTGSDLARAVIGRPTAEPAGVIGIAGRTPLTPQTRPLIPHGLWRGPGFVIGRHSTTAFLAVQDVPRERLPDTFELDLEEPYLLWSLILDGTSRPTAPLLPLALDATANWAQSLRELIRCSDPDSVETFTFYRPTCLRPWRGGRVAVIGDAAHPIPPTAGMGASIAIADAGELVSALGARTADPQWAVYDQQPLMLRRAAIAAGASDRVLAARALLRREWLRQPTIHVALPILDALIHGRPRHTSNTASPPVQIGVDTSRVGAADEPSERDS